MSAPVPNPGQNAPSAPNEGGNDTGATPTGDDAFKPITTPEEMKAFLADRVARAEKKAEAKYADYDVLKAAAAELAAIKEANKSEAEKMADALRAAEDRAKQAESAAMRARIQAAHGISNEDAELFLTGTDEAALTKQAEQLAKLRAETGGPRRPAPDLNQGRKQSEAGMTTAQQFEAFASQLLNK